MNIDELRRQSADEAPEWEANGYRLFVVNGEFLAHFTNEGPCELAAAARNALPALLRVVEAGRRVAWLWEKNADAAEQAAAIWQLSLDLAALSPHACQFCGATYGSAGECAAHERRCDLPGEKTP